MATKVAIRPLAIALWSACAIAAALAPAAARAPAATRGPAKPRPSQQAPAGSLHLRPSEGTLLQLARPASSIFLADPAIADIATPTERTIFVYGKKPGHTSLFALDAKGLPVASWRVLVGASDGDWRSLIRAKVGDYPVSLDMTPNGAVLSGPVPTPNVAERVRAVAAEFLGSGTPIVNNLRVAGSLQVQLQVRVAEVSRSVSKALGINWEASVGVGSNAVIGLFTGRTFLDGASSLLGGTGANAVQRLGNNAGALAGGYSHGRTQVATVLDALASESLVRDLAEPTLVATSGEEARFLAGGQFPVPVGQGLGQVGIDYKNFGVQLVFKPTVVNEDLISLKVAPEVSTLITDVSAGAITENGFTVPALSVRRAETTIELGSGQSFAIGGLLQDNINTVVSRFPGLGDIPVLGALFRSTSFQRQETELVIIVTPTIVRPIAAAAAVRLPTAEVAPPSDLELLLRGKLGASPGGRAALQGLGAARLRGNKGFELE